MEKQFDTSPIYNSVEEILEKAKSANNHKVSDYITSDFIFDKKGKGFIGQVIEEGLFGYKINSRKEADFAKFGVELKTTGIKQNKNKTISAKERLVLNIINYFEDANISFEDSSLWKKCKNLLIMFYLYDFTKKTEDFIILDSILNEFASKDLEIIKKDFEIIQSKIKSGNAHNISEADTMYLGACTKGETRDNSFRNQPYSKEKARQRAYCLKQSYMNILVRRLFDEYDIQELVSTEELKVNSFEDVIQNKLSKLYGKSETQLLKMFGLTDINSKAKFNILISRMLGIDGSVNKCEEFEKANIELKTIRIEENGTIREHMSFPQFVFKEIVNQEFEESDIFERLSSTKFLFAIFRKRDGVFYFERVLFWNMPYNDIFKYVKPVFQHTKRTIENGNIVKKIYPNKYDTNFLGSTFNNVCHVRPHDTASIRVTNKGMELPVKDNLTGLERYTKHCFWLDNKYILSIINASK